MRVLITRPEREATALATALGQRGHAPVIAPLFRLAGPASARRLRGDARRLPGDPAHQRQRRARAGRGERAAQQADLRRRRHHGGDGRGPGLHSRHLGVGRRARRWPSWCAQRLDPAGPAAACVRRRRRGRSRPAPDGFEVRRVVLYEAREAEALPDSARAALAGARARRRHLLLAARLGSLRPAGDGGRAWPTPAAASPRSPSARPPPSRLARCPSPDRRGRASHPPGRAG